MDKSPLERALDVFVYAPVGLALAARDALPDLIDKGREQLTGQVKAARVMGQMAVAQGQREAEKAISQATQRLAHLGRSPDGQKESARPKPESATTPSPSAPVGGEVLVEPTVSAASLAIPGYDALSAPQVVQRLAGLSQEELEAVREYEAATRHRKTILTRISQLQSPEPQ